MKDSDKLKRIIDEIPELIAANITSSDSGFRAWKTQTERFLSHKYGEQSIEYRNFLKTPFNFRAYPLGTPHSDFVAVCQKGLRECQVTFQTYLDEMLEDDIPEEAPAK